MHIGASQHFHRFVTRELNRYRLRHIQAGCKADKISLKISALTLLYNLTHKIPGNIRLSTVKVGSLRKLDGNFFSQFYKS